MYTILFVGLVCLFGQGPGRVALLPNALNDPARHIARIAIDDPLNIMNKSNNWGSDALSNGDFLLKEPCEVHFQDADVADPSHPLKVVRPPISLKSGFSVDPAAPNAIAKVPIMKGTMKAVLYPHSNPNNVEASVITQVDVQHAGPIQVRVKSVATGVVRTITLKPGTEIAVVNDLDPVIKECLALHGGMEHFSVYQRLGKAGAVNVGTTPPTPIGDDAFKVSTSEHRVFKHPINPVTPIVDGVKCPNTGCCP